MSRIHLDHQRERGWKDVHVGSCQLIVEFLKDGSVLQNRLVQLVSPFRLCHIHALEIQSPTQNHLSLEVEQEARWQNKGTKIKNSARCKHNASMQNSKLFKTQCTSKIGKNIAKQCKTRSLCICFISICLWKVKFLHRGLKWIAAQQEGLLIYAGLQRASHCRPSC